MTAIFILIPALLFALSVAGMVWIRVAAAEYRHNWKVPAGTPPARTHSVEATITGGARLTAVQPR